MIIDAHTHTYPNSLKKMKDLLPRGWTEKLRPLSRSFHTLQPYTRFFPLPVRKLLESAGPLLALPRLFLESSPEDLIRAMEPCQVNQALIIANPPWSSNEFVIETARAHPRLIPVVNIPHGSERPGYHLKQYVQQGAKALKIHPAMDGAGIESPTYRSLLHAAHEIQLPVILHTGEIHSLPLYKDPSLGQVDRFTPWFQEYPQTPFVLAHMNFSDPRKAMDLLEHFSNLSVDTSWQPTETIGECVRRVGPKRVLFGSDWPVGGENISVGVRRIRDCVREDVFDQDAADWILGRNASRLFRI